MGLTLVVLLVAILSGSAVYHQQSKTPRDFEANADLLFRFGREYYPISPGEQRRNWGENVIVTLDAAIYTEMRFLASHQLFERTLRTVGIDELALSPLPAKELEGKAEAVSVAEGDQYLAAVREVADMFVISRVEGAALVAIAVRHPVPDVADKLLNAHIENYLAWRRELFGLDASSYFDVQLARAREEHAELVETREALVAEYGIMDVPLEREILRRKLERAELGPDGDDSDPLAADTATIQGIREGLQRINTFENLVEPIDMRIKAILDNIASLESEEANWRLTQDFGEVVAPSVVAIDFRTAHGSPVGLDPKLGAVVAAVLSAIMASLMIAGFSLVFAAAAAAKQDPPNKVARQKG